MKYKADKTVVITGSNRKGESLGPIAFKNGTYTTTDEDEIELLDGLATDPSHPVGFDPKEEK